MTQPKRTALPSRTLALAVVMTLGACASVPRQPYTAAQAGFAEVPGIPGARAFADAPIKTLTGMVTVPSARSGPFTYLAISGGGGDGAYGAGVLKGWSESGRRPVFNLVSGVSTGALTAPFAFLGPAYDSTLGEIYTSGVAGTLVENPSLANVVFGAGLFGDQRLRDLVGRYVTPDLLAAVAAEHAKGRRLLVVTTNLDSKRAMIWNMGVIASSGAPNAAELFRDVLTASASVPAVFPAQLIDVEAQGSGFQELHVDGDVVTPVFTVPQALVTAGRGPGRAGTKADLYVLMNSRIEPEFALVQNDTLSIIGQTLTTGSQARKRAILASTYAYARANGTGFHLTYIDDAAPRSQSVTGFDTTYMRGLYQSGYEKARSGSAWRGSVPVAPLADRILSASR